MSLNPDSTLEFELVKTFSAQRLWYINMWRENGFDLEGIEWRTLNILWFNGPTPQSAFVELYGRNKTFATRLIDKMVSKGWVYREGDPEDRRSMIIYLTKEGADLKPVLIDLFYKARAQALRGIEEKDRKTFIRLLKHYRNNLL